MEQDKKINKKALVVIFAFIVLAVSFFLYCKYEQSKLKSPEGFSVVADTRDISDIGKIWLKAYTDQYKKIYVPRNQRIIDYSIDKIEIKERNVIQIDFTLETKKLNSGTSSKWNGTLEDDKVKCQWVLWFKEEAGPAEKYSYTVTRLQRPAGYDLEKYQTSGQKEKDEYKQKYETEIPYEKQQYTYKIENKICYVSFDGGNSWKEVPIPLNKLADVGDGRAYYNKLQEKSYVVSPEKTAFLYGGTRETPLTVIYSEDKGSTWNTVEVSKSIESARLRFCSFPTTKTGYVIVTGDRAMSQEMQIIYKTTDGGSTWREIGAGPRTSLLQYAGFIDENIGFMSYVKIEGAETNFYRTEDGGKSFQPIILPAVKQEWMGLTLEPFVQPETPYMEKGEVFLLVGQGPNGDFKGGRVMAKYKSEDKGKTWSFVKLVEPQSTEAG
jgi:hypothetical protein